MTQPEPERISLWPKMNPEVKEKWLESLRSGEYTRTSGRLRKSTSEFNAQTGEWEPKVGHCCLGVLTDLCIKEGVRKSKFPEISESGATKEARNRGVYLQPQVARWAKVPETVQLHLAGLNDSEEPTPRVWDVVIRFIEENL